MPYSYTQLPGDGSNTNFTFTFGYLSKLHISATVDGTSTSFSWLTDFSIQITPAPAAGTIVEIRRKTPLNAPVVDWADGSVLTESDMDLNSLFSLYAAQEAQDAVDSTVKLDVLGEWDGQGRSTKSFADAVEPTGLITKQQLEGTYKPDIDAAVANAEASALASANSASDSQASAVLADSRATDAATTLALFKGQYLGPHAVNPTVDGNGQPLTQGDLYFNTTVSEMRAYHGSGWVPVGSTVEGTMKRPPGYTPIIATAGQISVPVSGGYDPYNIITLVNGVAITSPDVDASSGTSLVFTPALSAGDEVDYYAFGLLSIANTFTKSELVGSGGAGNIGVSPAGGIASTTVQAALNELDTKKAEAAGDSTKTFSVALATQPAHAIQLAQAESRYAQTAGGPRQTVVSGGVNAAGQANFLSGGTGLSINLTASGYPVITTFAEGFGAGGAVDRIGYVSSNVTSAWSGLTASSTLFLYQERNSSTGALSYGFSTFAPVYADVAPDTPATDQHWFDLTAFRMKRWSGSAWLAVQRVFMGECVTGASSVTSVATYALNGLFKSTQFLIPAGNTQLQVAHNIAAEPVLTTCFLRNLTADAGYSPGDEVPIDAVLGSSSPYTKAITPSTNRLSTSVISNIGSLAINHKTSSAITTIVQSNWRIKFFSARGW